MTTLDLDGNELCGGTVAEDHSFGLVRGAAARLSEHGQLCRLDSDGCARRGRGWSRTRVLPHRARGDAGDRRRRRHLGVVRPDANRSSYPGSDDKGVGWRAKGGVRHLHNTVDMGGGVAGWGQGDRVGLMLDTHAHELTFYKNGKPYERKYRVALEGPLLFAVGRYYGSFAVRSLYVHQQGGNEEMDYSALERLCGLLARPANRLRELRIANNQLTGVSKFHGGRRNERGLRQLVAAFGAAECGLTHLDVSGNGLSEDAAALALVALRRARPSPSSASTWLVPVSELARGEALDLSAQGIADEDAALLARLLESRTRLRALDLHGNKLSTRRDRDRARLAASSAHPGASLESLSVASTASAPAAPTSSTPSPPHRRPSRA